MRVILRGVVLTILGVLVMPVSMMGHHGGASFDNTKEVTVKGTS
jgi:hypothetical protein